jgi:Uma2 family endonuclease
MSGDAAYKLDPEFPNLAPAVVEGYRHAPENVVAEIIDGALSLLPRPRRRHARTTSRLGGRLAGFDDPRDGDPGGWIILDEPELHLGPCPDVLIPDVAGWRTARTPPGFLADDAAGVTLAPDWVCEVLSPSTGTFDRVKKLPIYHREGVEHAWLIDPTAHTLEVFRRHDLGWLLVASFEGPIVVRAEPFDAIALDLAALWVD